MWGDGASLILSSRQFHELGVRLARDELQADANVVEPVGNKPSHFCDPSPLWWLKKHRGAADSTRSAAAIRR
jgi:hypothetical protein